MDRPAVSAKAIGGEKQPLVTIDGFSSTPAALREAAMKARFEPALHHYPGIRAALPPDYLTDQLPLITQVVRAIFARYGPLHVIDASFSIVTTPSERLSLHQRLPHCDAFSPDRIALIHYLSLEDMAGTAFFRHRSTGFETVTENRRATYFHRLEEEVINGDDCPAGYIADDTPLFERIALAPATYNRALLYPSFLLHSGAIPPDAPLSPDPAVGRLTVTAFLSAA